jgi:hypothetical protein
VAHSVTAAVEHCSDVSHPPSSTARYKTAVGIT